MSRFTTIRRRLLLGAGFVVVLSGLSLCVAHTALVRRFALVQIQTRLGNTEGLILKARDLDYNLLTGRFELKEVVVRGSQLADMPPALQAQRVALVIPTWRLLRGSFESAQIRIDGLAVRWITGRDGRANLPPIPTGTGGKSGGPSIIVNGAAFYVQDDRNGLALALTNAHLSAIWNSQKREYAIACRTSGGEARWNQMRLALDQLQLKSTLAGGNFSLESLSLVSGSSQALLTGALSGSPGRVQASANFDLDLDQLSRALSPTAPARGRVQVHVSAGGPLEAMLLDASLRGEDLVIGGIPIRSPDNSPPRVNSAPPPLRAAVNSPPV
jgi:hypothetical protein